MKIGYMAFVVLCSWVGLLIAGCQSSEPKPITAEDKAKMMDRSDVPKGYLDANKARMGQSGPVNPPQNPPATGG